MKTFFIYTALPLLVSCISTKEILKKYRNENIKNSEIMSKDINGIYSNNSLSINNSEYLFTLFKRKFSFKYAYKSRIFKSDSMKISLNYDGKKTLIVQNTTTGEKINLKVKNHKKYLTTKRKIYCIPIPFLFFLYKEQKFILFKNNADNLVVIDANYSLAWVLLMADNIIINKNTYKIN